MTTPPIKISDEAIKAATDAAMAHYREWQRMPNREAYVNTLVYAVTTSVAEAVAPLIAARVLRSAADKIRPIAKRLENSGDPFDAEGAAYLRDTITMLTEWENGRERSPACPLCGGHGMNFAKCARCGRQADPPCPCPDCGRTSHGFACSARSLTEDAP